jgi:hypothetical protein
MSQRLQLLAVAPEDAERASKALRDAGIMPLAEETVAHGQDPLPALTRLLRGALAMARERPPPAPADDSLVLDLDEDENEATVDAPAVEFEEEDSMSIQEAMPQSWEERKNWLDSLQLSVGESKATKRTPRWKRLLAELGGQAVEAPFELAPSISKSAPVLAVLNSAGSNMTVRVDGEIYRLFGYPSLGSPNARILAVGSGEPFGEVLVLHRQPNSVGICKRGGGLLPSTGRMGATAREVTGHDYPESGRLFAVETDAVYVMEGGARVWRWDGRRRTTEGSPQAAMASLLLRWSQQ